MTDNRPDMNALLRDMRGRQTKRLAAALLPWAEQPDIADDDNPETAEPS